jgi:CRISPR type III-A-associated RAMP protein Csm4
LKKLRYLGIGTWTSLARGETVRISPAQIKGGFLVDRGTCFDIPFESQVSQRVSVPRDEQDPAPFFFDWTFFRPDAGLYCLTDATGALFDELVSLFKILGETGIGTDRNVGGGKFDIETDSLSLPDVPAANQLVLLSLYIPTSEELSLLHLTDSHYDLLLRGGFIAGSQEEDLRHLRKRSIYMFNVGSLFPTTSPIVGKIVDLAPEWNDPRMHPVYRSGRPFYLPIKKG